MNEEVKNELKRRCDILISNTDKNSIDRISALRFEMALAPIGYPFTPTKWMDESYTKKILSSDEYDSGEYDEFIRSLYEYAATL